MDNINYYNDPEKLMSNSIANIAKALSQAQYSMLHVVKDKSVKVTTATGASYNYNYAELCSCLEALKQPFRDNGLSVTQPISIENDKTVLLTMLMHESGEWIKSKLVINPVILKTKEGKDLGNPLQALGGAITYCRRYALAALVGLGQEDDDAQFLTDGYSQVSTRAKKEPKVELKQPPMRKPIHQKTSVSKEVINFDEAKKNLDNNEAVQLKKKCLEHSIDPKTFANLLNIKSTDLASVRDALNNWDSKKKEYEEKSIKSVDENVVVTVNNVLDNTKKDNEEINNTRVLL